MLRFAIFIFLLFIPGLFSAVQHVQIRKVAYNRTFIIAVFIYSYLILMLMSATKFVMGNGFEAYQLLEGSLTYIFILKYSALALVYAFLLPHAVLLIEQLGKINWRK